MICDGYFAVTVSLASTGLPRGGLETALVHAMVYSVVRLSVISVPEPLVGTGAVAGFPVDAERLQGLFVFIHTHETLVVAETPVRVMFTNLGFAQRSQDALSPASGRATQPINLNQPYSLDHA